MCKKLAHAVETSNVSLTDIMNTPWQKKDINNNLQIVINYNLNEEILKEWVKNLR